MRSIETKILSAKSDSFLEKNLLVAILCDEFGLFTKIQTLRVRLDLFLEIHLKRAQTTTKDSITKDIGTCRVLLRNKIKMPNIETNRSKHLLWKSLLILPKQTRKDGSRWSISAQKLRWTPLHANHDAITIHSCGPNSESGRNEQARNSGGSPFEDN